MVDRNTISHAGLVGGGKIPRPGEISLAHRGVLFRDELPEFDERSLEDHIVTISRASGTLTFPANFQLIAAWARRTSANTASWTRRAKP